jgi:hypothetical protein
MRAVSVDFARGNSANLIEHDWVGKDQTIREAVVFVSRRKLLSETATLLPFLMRAA